MFFGMHSDINNNILRSTTLEGITTIETNTVAQESGVVSGMSKQSFAASVQSSLQNYFSHLDGAEPANVYDMVLAEMEIPLLRVVMSYTNGNQSKAAKILGISRGTLRKKLAIYQIDEKK